MHSNSVKSVRWLWRATALASATLLFVTTPTGVSEAPVGPPTFSDPLTFTNAYFPFEAGAVKLHRGKSDGARIFEVEEFLADIRTFDWNGTQVDTHVVREIEFEDGELVETSYNFFAQADDGSVYFFGELVDVHEDGQVASHEGSWLVGGATEAGDPAETILAADPSVFMPGSPEVGDQFKPEDLFPMLDGTVLVLGFESKLKVHAGTFQDVMKVRETSQLPDSDPEKKWYAPGIGVIRSGAPGEKSSLVATTLRPPEAD